MTQPQTYDANQVLMGGGAGHPAWKFDQPNPGAPRVGTIVAPPQARQERDYDKNNPGGGDPKFFPSGDPIMGILVEVQTNERDPSVEDDDGVRVFYIEGRYLKEAVREAVRTAGSPGLEVGGQLYVTFTHREDPMDKRSRKFWQIQYVPGANAALMADPAQQQVPQQQVPQQPAPQQPVYAPPAPQAPVYQPPAPQQAYAPQQPPVAPAPAPQPAPPAPPAPPAAAAPAPTQPTPEQLAAYAQWQATQGQQSA